jgi:hypothetical protein
MNLSEKGFISERQGDDRVFDSEIRLAGFGSMYFIKSNKFQSVIRVDFLTRWIID